MKNPKRKKKKGRPTETEKRKKPLVEQREDNAKKRAKGKKDTEPTKPATKKDEKPTKPAFKKKQRTTKIRCAYCLGDHHVADCEYLKAARVAAIQQGAGPQQGGGFPVFAMVQEGDAMQQGGSIQHTVVPDVEVALKL